jgi:hypothetical protein
MREEEGRCEVFHDLNLQSTRHSEFSSDIMPRTGLVLAYLVSFPLMGTPLTSPDPPGSFLSPATANRAPVHPEKEQPRKEQP